MKQPKRELEKLFRKYVKDMHGESALKHWAGSVCEGISVGFTCERIDQQSKEIEELNRKIANIYYQNRWKDRTTKT